MRRNDTGPILCDACGWGLVDNTAMIVPFGTPKQPKLCRSCRIIDAIESLANEMETDDRAGKLAHWIVSLRRIAGEEAK